jgi:hypothetical protein
MALFGSTRSIRPVRPRRPSSSWGDVVTSIDGIDVMAVPTDTARSLLYVHLGTTVRLGLARGITIATVPR